jgi:Short C-terminal domain
MLVSATSGAFWLFALFWGLIWAAVGANMAKKRGRSETVWGVVCFVIGLVGVIVLAIAGKTEEKKREDVQKYLPTSQVPNTVPPDWTEELRKLGELHDSGALSDEEFTHEKERILAHH